MLLSLALAATLAAEPSVAVLAGRRTAVPVADAQALAQSVSTELLAAKVLLTLDASAASAKLARLGLKDSTFCGGKKACLLELGKQLVVEHVLVVSASQVGSDRSVALELWKVADGSVLEREGLLVPPGTTLPADLLAPFAAKLRARFPGAAPVPPPEPVKPPDVPVAPKPPEPVALVPAPMPPVVVAPVTPSPEPRSHVTGLVLGGAGVLALAAGVVLVVSGLAARTEATRTELVDGTLRSPLTASEAQTKANTANLELGLAGGAGAVALGLGAAAAWSW